MLRSFLAAFRSHGDFGGTGDTRCSIGTIVICHAAIVRFYGHCRAIGIGFH